MVERKEGEFRDKCGTEMKVGDIIIDNYLDYYKIINITLYKYMSHHEARTQCAHSIDVDCIDERNKAKRRTLARPPAYHFWIRPVYYSQKQ